MDPWKFYDADDFSTHQGNVAIGIEEGLTPLYVMASSEDNWDRYESLKWQAGRDIYLRWGRDTLGWAPYLFRR